MSLGSGARVLDSGLRGLGVYGFRGLTGVEGFRGLYRVEGFGFEGVRVVGLGSGFGTRV